MSEGVVRANRAVWDLASQKHIREYDELIVTAISEAGLATHVPAGTCVRWERFGSPLPVGGIVLRHGLSRLLFT